MNEHFDVIIIGTGAGGGTLLHRLAASGKRILVLERGRFLPREKDNWSYHGSFKYYSSEVMFNKDGGEIRPGFSYHVGGNTKVYGAALFRLREKDFESFRHRDGFSPEWPIKYRDWENYYTQAEEVYEVHGKAGEDPTEPWRAKDYPFPPISHEPRIKEVFEILKTRGIKPYPAPMGVRINEAMMHLSPCIRCDTCDGYPCLVGTCKFGEDPSTSVLDLDCRAHDVDNLYVVDGSFFVSSGAVNPTLTIIANALRVGDHLIERLGARTAEFASVPKTMKEAARHQVLPEMAMA